MSELNLLQSIIAWGIPLLFAITLHEYAHGYVALRCGDKTALMLGRLTVNPIKHIDLVGTIILPTSMVLMSIIGGYDPFVFGWAKPVPVNWQHLRNPKRDMAWVAVAGPAANFFMAVFFAICVKIGLVLQTDFSFIANPLIYIGSAGILVNIVLMVLNLLPILPLDGGRILVSVLPQRLGEMLGRIEPFGFIIVIALLLTGILYQIMGPAILFTVKGIYQLIGI